MTETKTNYVCPYCGLKLTEQGPCRSIEDSILCISVQREIDPYATAAGVQKCWRLKVIEGSKP